MKKQLMIAISMIFMVIVISGAVSAADGTWQTEIVDGNGTSNPDVGSGSSLALDSSNNPHISYYDDTNGNLKYAYQKDGIWTIETVDAVGNINTRIITSIAIDNSNNPHISYYESTNSALKYAYRTGPNTWVTETVDNSGDVGDYSSLSLSKTNSIPHISYSDSTSNAIKYTYRVGPNTWFILPDSIPNGDEPNLVLDSSNSPHISYTGTDFKVHYAYWSAGIWADEIVDDRRAGCSDIALDSSNIPHIAYHLETGGADHGYIAYAYRIGSNNWHTETLPEFAGWMGTFISIALDQSNNPHISYWENNAGTGALKYAHKINGIWNVLTIDGKPNILIGAINSIAIDSVGNPHIAYYDATNGNLKYAHFVLNQVTPYTNSSNLTQINAKTVGMQETGIPISWLILSVLMLAGGLVVSKR